jgi:hypothetical protein
VSRATGINAFLYLHANHRAGAPGEIPETDPGRLERKRVTVEPDGNRVRSNLDVVAPDDVGILELRRHLFAFVERAQFDALPWHGVEGPCRFRIHMVPQLVKAGWAREVKALASAGAELVESLRPSPLGSRSTKQTR